MLPTCAAAPGCACGVRGAPSAHRRRSGARVPGSMDLIADSMRRETLRGVWDTELPVNALVAAFDVSQPAISMHLRLLREGGLMCIRPQGIGATIAPRPRRWAHCAPILRTIAEIACCTLKDEADLGARWERIDTRQLRSRLRGCRRRHRRASGAMAVCTCRVDVQSTRAGGPAGHHEKPNPTGYARETGLS